MPVFTPAASRARTPDPQADSPTGNSGFLLNTFCFLFTLLMVPSISMAYIILGCLGVVLVYQRYIQQKSGPGPMSLDLPLAPIFCAYLLWSLFSSLLGIGVSRSLMVCRKELLCLMFWVLYLTFKFKPSARRWALKGFSVSMAFLALTGICQFVIVHWFPAWNERLVASSWSWVRAFAMLPIHGMRAHGPVHTLTYAEAMGLGGLAVIGIWGKRLKVGMSLSILCLLALLASASRGPVLGFAAGFIVIILGHARLSKKSTLRLVVPIAAFGCLFLIAAPVVSARLMTTFQLEHNQDRLAMWKVGWNVIRDHPWKGIGVAQIGKVWESYFKQEGKATFLDGQRVWSDVHNLYLQVAAERGLIGLGILLVLLGSITWRAFMLLKDDTENYFLHLAAFAGIVAFWTMNFTESAFQDTEIVFVMYFLMAATWSLYDWKSPRLQSASAGATETLRWPKRILYVTEAAGWTGGASRLWIIAQKLQARGYEIAVACRHDADLGQRLRQAGITVFPLAIRQDYDIVSAYRLARYARRWQADIIHAEHPQAHAVTLLASYFLRPISLFVTRHVMFPIKKNPFSKLKYCSSRITRYVAVSDSVAERLVAAGIDKNKVVAVPPGVDLEKWGDVYAAATVANVQGPRVVTSVGNFSSYKGQTVLLEAAAKILKILPETRFRFVGRDTEQLKPLAEKLGVSDNVEILGERSDIPNILSTTNLFVMPSLMEGFGIALIEAQAAMIPVVASAVGGLCQIVTNNETGLLVPPGNPKALSDAIIHMLENPGEAQRMAANGYEVVKAKFSLETMMDSLEGLYKEVAFELSARSHVSPRGSRSGDHALGLRAPAPVA